MTFRFSALLAMALIGGVAHAQERVVTSDEGDEGAELGKELLQNAPKVTHDPNGGERGAGSLTIEGVGTVGVNEIAPGADRSRVDALSNRARGLGRHNAEQEGAAALREGLQDQTSSGEALRTMVTSEAMSESELAGDQKGFWEQTAAAVRAGSTGTLSGVFADCKDEVQLSEGPAIVVETKTEFTCERNVDSSPRCGRQREVLFAEIDRQEETVPVYSQLTRIPNTGLAVGFGVGALSERMKYRDYTVDVTVDGDLPAGVRYTVEVPSEDNAWQGVVMFASAPLVDCPPEEGKPAGSKCTPPQEASEVTVTAKVVLAAGDWYEEQIIEGPGNCLERFTQEFSCPIKFECASEISTLDGKQVSSALAARLNMSPLYADEEGLEGARQVTACAVAEAIPFCTVCANDDTNTNCVTPDVRQAQGRTCSALENDRSCSEQGQAVCILFDELNPSRCVTWSHTYVCTERQVTDPEIISTVRNSCDLPEVPCSGDGCRQQDALRGDDEGISLQRGLAGLAVAQAIVTDVQEAPKAASSAPPAASPGAPVASEGNAWGYDEDDGEGFTDGSDDLASNAPGAGVAVDTSKIQLFRGEANSCKKALGGLIKCCQPTRTDANQRYWNLFGQMNRGALAADLLSRQGPTTGGWAALAGGGSLNALSQSLTSGRENVLGGGSGGATTGSGSMQEIHERFMNEARTQIRPNLSPSWACSQREFDLAVQREIGSCSFAGTYCKRKVFGVCLETREAYCCYSSPMSKLLRAHADGGTIQHGSPKAPNCDGIPLDRMASIDWDSLDVSPLVGNMQQGGAFPASSEQAGAIERYTGSGATAGGSGRVNVVERTGDRLGAIDMDRASGAIREEAEGYAPNPVVDNPGPAVLSFGTTYHVGRADGLVVVSVTRDGSAGPASSVVGPVGGASLIEEMTGATQSWADGDVSVRNVRVKLVKDAPVGSVIELRLTTQNQPGAVMTALIEVIE